MNAGQWTASRFISIRRFCISRAMILRPPMRSYVDGLHLPPSFMPELVAILKTAGALEGRVCTCDAA